MSAKGRRVGYVVVGAVTVAGVIAAAFFRQWGAVVLGAGLVAACVIAWEDP